MPNDDAKWPIPTVPWGQARHKIAFDDASEEVKAKFRELYPVSYNKEMAGWFGISECMVKYIGQRLGLRKDRRKIAQRNIEPYKHRLYDRLKRIRETAPDPDHPYWVCFDGQTTRSPRMEKNAMAMGLEIVEGED